MPSACIEFYFDFTCPYAYMASTLIGDIARDHDAILFWRPMLLGGVFQSLAEGHSPMDQAVPAKARHTSLDMFRFADRMNVPMRMPAGHPMRSVRALRALLSLTEMVWPAVIHEIYRAYWVRGDDITDPDIIAQALEAAAIPQAHIARALRANDDPIIKDNLRRRTDDAVSRGIFGAPTMFVHVDDGNEPYFFWGQDRLHMVRAVLQGWRPERSHEGPSDGTPRIPEDEAADETGPTASMRAQPVPRQLHFFYDFSSPFAYLASTQVERIAEETGAELIWRPMLLGAVFRELGTSNVPILAMPESKRRYTMLDLEYWAAYWDVPFVFASHFPQRSVTALRLALLAGDRIAGLSHALFRVPWVDDRRLDDESLLAQVLTEQGFPAQDMLARTQEPEVKQMLVANTAEAIDRGVFGAPTCIVEDHPGAATAKKPLLFWGQDRLDLVTAALRGWRPRLES